MNFTIRPRIIDHGCAVEYLGGADARIDDGPWMNIDEVRAEIRSLEKCRKSPIALNKESLKKLSVFYQIERRLMTEHDNVIAEPAFASSDNGYWIDRNGTVWQDEHSSWVSMVRGDGKRLYIQDLTPSDSVIVHGLVQKWEGWSHTVVGSPLQQKEPAGANGPGEPLPDTNCDGHVFAAPDVEQPWNELGPFRIHDNGTVECIDVGVIVSAVAKPPYPPGRSYHVTFRSDSGRHCHDQLVLRWEARHKKSDLERVREAVQLPEECNWRIGKTGRLCVYDSRNEFELLECSEAEAASHQLLARAMRRDAQMHEALVKAVAVLNEPSKGNGTPE